MRSQAGDEAPGFTVLDMDLNEVSLGDFDQKIKVISVTPSLDTPVCHLMATTFNKKAESLSEEIVVLNISVDLPFAIARFHPGGPARLKTLSDHRDVSFGMAYGVLIKELRLLARSVFVIGKSNVVRYVEIVPEITDEPKYDDALKMAEELPG